MTAELQESLDDERPNVSGDLPTLFEAAPMFRRAVAGYDRFQVDTYVQWAEDELATAGREREHLMARHLRTRADLEDARELLSHSADGAEFLRQSRRIGSVLAAAADEAEAMRAEGAAERAAAVAMAEQRIAQADQTLAVARAEAQRMLGEAATQAAEVTAEAARALDEARRASAETHAAAELRLEEARAIERRAVEQADGIRQRAVAEAAEARLQARGEIVHMLTAGREERRRADAMADAARERLDRDADGRRAALLAEIAKLERRRAVLTADLRRKAQSAATASHGFGLRGHLERIVKRPRSA
jgi:hypothetical protein